MDKIRWQHALCYTIERAITTYDWLKQQQVEYLSRISQKNNASEAASRVRVLCDIFSVYVTTLITGGKNRTFSLKEKAPDIYEKIKDLEIIKKCEDNRHNRSAHEADSYGHFVSAEDILSSEIRSILEAIRATISTR